jgi:cob(I)alamin adenosyltransferase
MVRLNKIYTRSGDSGMTGLGSGERLPKSAPRVAAYGTVDETNAAIGLARAHLAGHQGLDAKLMRIQNDLFDLGADLCVRDGGGKEDKSEVPALRITDDQVKRLEGEIDEMNAELKPLKSFVLPGGSPAAAALHLARTICRRAEREMVALARSSTESVNPAALKYINRLSDFLFVASRYVNDRGKSDVLWVPGQNR